MAMADIARHAQDAPVSIAAVAERQKLSVPYLEQLFMLLRRAGLVESARGRSGGYRLGRPAADISIAAVMAAVEEDTRMTRCNGTGEGGCASGAKCLTHDLWDALGEHIYQFLDRTTLADVLNGIESRPARGRSLDDFTMAAE